MGFWGLSLRTGGCWGESEGGFLGQAGAKRVVWRLW